MIEACETVQFLDGHLLNTDAVAESQVAQLGHKLSLGTFADIEFLDLLARLNGLGHRANTKYYIFILHRFGDF